MLYIALDRQKSVGCREVAFCLVGHFILNHPVEAQTSTDTLLFPAPGLDRDQISHKM